MDLSTRDVVAKAFNNHPELQQFVMTNVTLTGKTLGSGSFGSILEVCACMTS
jgi:hypothetical protein